MSDQAKKKTIAIFCGSKTGDNPLFAEHAASLGKMLAESGFDIVYGGGVSFYVGKGGIGTEYTGIFGPNTYSNEIYDTPIKKDMSVYCIFGRKLNDKTTIISKIGLGTQVKYYNGYDKSQILSPSGYWFLREYSGADVIVGSVIQHKVKHLITYIGYDTFNGVTVGIGVNLN